MCRHFKDIRGQRVSALPTCRISPFPRSHCSQPEHQCSPNSYSTLCVSGSLEDHWRLPGGIGLHTRPLGQLLCTPVAGWSSFPSHPHYIQLLTHMFHFAIVLHITDSVPQPQNSYVKILIPQYFRCVYPWT